MGPFSSSLRPGSSMDARKWSWSASVISKVVSGASSHLLVKLRDVRRDPHIAVHSPTIEVPAAQTLSPDWPGDAKLAGLAAEVPPPADTAYVGAGFFRMDITEVVLTYVGEPRDHLVIESWHPGVGLRRRTAR